MSRAIDMIITYRVVKLLVTPFEKMEAFKRGIIDKDGKVLIKFKSCKHFKAWSKLPTPGNIIFEVFLNWSGVEITFIGISNWS